MRLNSILLTGTETDRCGLLPANVAPGSDADRYTATTVRMKHVRTPTTDGGVNTRRAGKSRWRLHHCNGELLATVRLL